MVRRVTTMRWALFSNNSIAHDQLFHTYKIFYLLRVLTSILSSVISPTVGI